VSSSQCNEAIEVFFSYSHRDEDLRNEMIKHLGLLQRQGVIRAWHDRIIDAGMEWKQAIDIHLQTAHIILLLVSADFLASDYCYDLEMERAMARHEAGEACVIPIILRAVDWNSAPFGKLQALPVDGKPITSWSNQDEAFTNVAQGLRTVVEKLTVPPLPTPDIQSIQGVEKSKDAMALCKTEMEIEITIMREFDTYSNADQERLLRAIRLFLEMEEGEIKITKKHRGSVKLTLSIPRDKAEQLFRAIKAGKFEEYGAVDAELNELTKVPEYVQSLTFDGNYYTAVLDKRFFEGNNHYYLAIKVDMPPRELERLFAETGKICPREEMEQLRVSALPGLAMHYLEAPPEELPRRAHFNYFALDHRGYLWRRIEQRQNIAVYCQLPPDKVEMQLLVLEEDQSGSESLC
jgi:hypothetical protein